MKKIIKLLGRYLEKEIAVSLIGQFKRLEQYYCHLEPRKANGAASSGRINRPTRLLGRKPSAFARSILLSTILLLSDRFLLSHARMLLVEMTVILLILSSCASIEKSPLAIRTHEYGSFEFKQVGLGGFSESCEILYEKKIVHGLFVLPINPLNKEELPSIKNKKIRIKYLIRKLDLLYNALGFVFSVITQTIVVEDCGRTNNRDDLAEQKSVDFMKSFLGKYEKIKALRDEGKLNVKIVNGRMVIVLSTDVLFNVGSKELSFKGKKAIIEITKILSEIEDQKFQVEGHTDNDPFKAEGATNWDLAASRALSVLNEMIKTGMPPTKISAASFGDARPLVANDTPSNKKHNRRIEIVVLPDIESLPGYE